MRTVHWADLSLLFQRERRRRPAGGTPPSVPVTLVIPRRPPLTGIPSFTDAGGHITFTLHDAATHVTLFSSRL